MKRRPLKLLFYCNLALIAALLGYKAYLNITLPEFDAEHARQLERIDERVASAQPLAFAVVGNINNSVGVFENHIVPEINASEAAFMVSAGNAVISGGEDKYQALYGTLGRLSIPWLLTFGDHEHRGFGSYRFYEHFGPHYFSFRIGASRLIFLDSTGKTAWQWQMRWFEDLLENDDSEHRIVFIGHPLFEVDHPLGFDGEDDYVQPAAFREALIDAFDRHEVDLVFSANLSTWSDRSMDGTRYVVTGGGGGLVFDTDESFHHYVMVHVDERGPRVALKRIETSQHPLMRRLESFWFFVYSLFYTGLVNFVLIVSALVVLAIKLRAAVFRDRDYYPDYETDPTPWQRRALRVAMFSNNYLPFVGGVPISIERLRRGLAGRGDEVLVVAPRYRTQPESERGIVRVPSLLTMGSQREFRIANIFSRRIGRRVRRFGPEVIHLHHPFWLGSLGLWLARRLDVPAIYTYHTRLEHYAHYVPVPGRLFRNLVSHALVRRFANKCDGVIVPTASAEEYLRMIGVRRPVLVQPTGIDYEHVRRVDPDVVEALRRKLNLAPDERVLVSVSRLSKEKNINFLLEALATLADDGNPSFRLLLIGDGNERERLVKRAEEMGLGERVDCVGAVAPEDMAAWYHLGDLFVFASRSETQGMVILEAMAAGLPVVAVRSSGIDDVVQQGQTGFKTAEDRQAWAARVRELLEDDALRSRLADRARELAARHAIDPFAARVHDFYAQLLAARGQDGKRD